MISRRDWLAGCAAMAAMSSVSPVRAQSSLGEVVLSGGHVLTMDDATGDLQSGDVHVRDGGIVAVAPGIQAPGVPRIDMSGRVVMPGFVDTHWHMWNTIARGLPESRLGPFAKTMAALSKVWTPQASALGVRLAAAEAVNSGITTVNNWAHNVASPEFAAAELEAQRASGLRGRFSYGYPQAATPSQLMDVAALEAMKTREFGSAAGGLVDLGLCVRGPDRCEEKVWRAEWAAARDLDLPLTTHIASDRKAAGMGHIGVLAKGGLLGPKIQLVHATHATAAEFALIAEAGSPIAISPWTELEVGYGLPGIALMAASGATMGLSVDNMVLAGTADMFSVMKLTVDLAAGVAETQSKLSSRKALEWATRDGARGLGYGDHVGILAPGRRADIIAVRADALNTSPAGTPEFMLTHAARPENVDLVMIDGVVHKRDGRLTMIDLPALSREARASIADLRGRAGL